jgi:DNA-binding NarL/FixJ family response regulator
MGNVQIPHIDLSSREKEILIYLSKGKSYKMIAEACYISVNTVSTHMMHIYQKLHVNSATEALAKARDNKLNLRLRSPVLYIVLK